MDQTEYDALLTAQAAYLGRIKSWTRFTASLLCQMHRDWLGGIYEWAGKYRSVEMAKAGFHWPPAFRVPANMQAFENGLLRQDTPCRPGPVQEVTERIARVHADLLLIHPFRDGNGRLARWLADLMAMQAGFPPLDYRFSGRGSRRTRAEYLAAVKLGYLADYAPLADFFREALLRRFPEAADR